MRRILKASVLALLVGLAAGACSNSGNLARQPGYVNPSSDIPYYEE
jgi:hypothetical protein